MFCHAWLVLLCETLGGVGGGLVTLRSQTAAANFELVAWLPSEGAPSDRLIATAKVVEQDGQRIAVKQPTKDGGELVHAGYPIVFAQALRAVVALHLDPRPDGQLVSALRQLQWASSTMEVLFRRIEASQAPVPPVRLQAALETMAAIAGQEKFHGAAFALVSSLATRFEGDRVSVGFGTRETCA